MSQPQEKEPKPDLYVVSRFLEKLIASGGSRRKTELQMAVGLNYNVYTKYLEWLENKNLINIREDAERSKHISLTPKGIETYKTLVKWIKDIIGNP